MKDIIILGMGATRVVCPFDAPVYSCNTGYRQVAEMNGRINKIFLAHTQKKDSHGDIIFNWEEINTLIDAGVEVFNIHKVKGLNSKMYPMKRLIKKFGTDYFSDTIAYMLAYAIDEATKIKDGKIVPNGAIDRLRLYGVDMLERGEYGLEKGGIEYWIGYARGLGLEVGICDGTALLRTVTGAPYGIKNYSLKRIVPPEMLRKWKRKEIITVDIEDESLQQSMNQALKVTNAKTS